MNKDLRLLLVEDSEDDALLILRRLRRDGFEVRHLRVETAEEIESALRGQEWDVVLCDFSLQKMSGLQVLEMYKTFGLDLPFIIVSGAIGEETAVEVMRAGAHDCIMKDNLSRLAPALERELGEAENRRRHRRAEEELRRQKDFMDTVLRSLSHTLYVVDAENYNIVMANPAARAAGIVEGSACYAASHQLSRPCRGNHPCPLEEVKKTGAAVRMEHIHTDKEGRACNVEVHGYPVFDDDGKVVMMIEYNIDITDRKEKEQELSRRKAEFEAIFRSILDAVVFVDTQRRIVLVNPAFTRILGYGLDDVKGRTSQVFYADPDDYLAQGNERYRVGAPLKPPVYEVKYRRKDGTVFDSETLGGPVRDAAGNTIGFIGVIRDISEKRRMESQLLQAQKMEAVGTMAGGVAHDFRNLLQVILGYSEMLLMTMGEDNAWETELAEIQRAAERGAELTGQLLTFSRKVESHRTPTDLNGAVKEVGKLLSRTIPKMIRITLDLNEGLDWIEADPNQIEQVLLNISNNAKDAMPQGGELSFATEQVILDDDFCRTHLEVRPGRYAMLTISDTGHGMDRETAEHIFEPFFTTKGVGEGTGLGLSTVFGIVKSHEGHVNCYSEPGRGTSFTLYFHSIEATHDRGEQQGIADVRGGEESVLVVDDEIPIRKLAENMLVRKGYSVMTAGSGEEALEVYREKGIHIDLIVMDLGMPGMGGERCLEELKKIDPAVRVLVASGYSGGGQAKKYSDLGASCYITKPYRFEALLAAVREALSS